MKTYEELCAEVEAIDPVKYPVYIGAHSRELISVLNPYFNDDEYTTKITLIKFYMAFTYADGKMQPDEFDAMIPLLLMLVGREIDFYGLQLEMTKDEKYANKLKKASDEVIDAIGELNDSAKEELIKISLMVCSADGKLKKKEKKYIEQLIK